MITNPNNYPCEFDGYMLPETIKEETEETRIKLEESKQKLNRTIAEIKKAASERAALANR